MIYIISNSSSDIVFFVTISRTGREKDEDGEDEGREKEREKKKGKNKAKKDDDLSFHNEEFAN